MKFRALMICLLMVVIVLPTFAQDGDALALANDWYSLMQDDDGIYQVYRFDADDGTRTQLTFSQDYVEHYDIVGTDVAYVSGDGVYLNDEKVATLNRPATGELWAATVQLSPLGGELTFSDQDGILVLNLETGETELLIENTGSDDNRDPDTYRRYYRADYTSDPDVLIVYVGVWEVDFWVTFNRATNTLNEAIFQMENPLDGERYFNRLKMLNDGQMLLYVFPPYDGCLMTSCALWVAPSSDMESIEVAVDDATLDALYPDADLSAIWDVVEVEAGVIRLFMSEYNILDDGTYQTVQVVAEANLVDGTATLIFDPVMQGDDGSNDNLLSEPQFSPDGRFLTGRGTVTVVDEDGTQSKKWSIIQVDLATGERAAFAIEDEMLVNLELATE